MSKSAIRVPLVEVGTRPELAAIEQTIFEARGRVSILYQALLNSAAIAQGWEAMLSAVRNHCAVPADWRELMILRVAVLNKASFEFEAHIPHALKAGLSGEKIEGLKHLSIGLAASDADLKLFSTDEIMLVKLTDHMTRDVVVPSALMDELAREHSPQMLVELVATVAAYNMVSRFLVALNITH